MSTKTSGNLVYVVDSGCLYRLHRQDRRTEGRKRLCCLTSCYNLVEAHCYGISRTGQIVEQSRSSEKTDRNVMHCN